MICTQLTIGEAGGTEYKLEIQVEPIWGNVASAAASIADFFSGLTIFGYKFDVALLGGWDITKVEYSTNKIDIYLKEAGSVPIIVLVELLWPYIVWLLTALGILTLGWKLVDLANNIVSAYDNSENREADTKRAGCIQTQLAAGKTEEEALKICQISYPEKEKGTDWGTIFLIGAGILGLAYVLGEKK